MEPRRLACYSRFDSQNLQRQAEGRGFCGVGHWQAASSICKENKQLQTKKAQSLQEGKREMKNAHSAKQKDEDFVVWGFWQPLHQFVRRRINKQLQKKISTVTAKRLKRGEEGEENAPLIGIIALCGAGQAAAAVCLRK